MSRGRFKRSEKQADQADGNAALLSLSRRVVVKMIRSARIAASWERLDWEAKEVEFGAGEANQD